MRHLFLMGALLLALPLSANAEMRSGMTNVTATLGVYNGAGNTSINGDGGAALGMSIGAQVAQVSDHAALDIALHWFRDSSKYSQTTPTSPPTVTTAKTSFRDVSLLMGSRYNFQLADRSLVPFVHGGLELAFWSVESRITSDNINQSFYAEASDTDAGIYLGGGARYGAGDRLDLTGMLTMHTAVSGFVALNFGIAYAL